MRAPWQISFVVVENDVSLIPCSKAELSRDRMVMVIETAFEALNGDSLCFLMYRACRKFPAASISLEDEIWTDHCMSQLECGSCHLHAKSVVS